MPAYCGIQWAFSSLAETECIANWNSAVGVQIISQQKNSIQVTHVNIFTANLQTA